MTSELDLQAPEKDKAFRLWLEGYTLAGIARKTGHAPETLRGWLAELEAEVRSTPTSVSRVEQNREYATRRLNNLKREAWSKFHSLFFDEETEKAGLPRVKGGHMAASRYMEMIIRAEELQARLEGLIGPGTHDKLPADGRSVVRTIKWVVTGPDGDGAQAGALVEATRVFPDQGAAIGPGGRDRLGEEPRGSDPRHRLLVTVDTIARGDPGADEPEPQRHDDPQVLRALPAGGDQGFQPE